MLAAVGVLHAAVVGACGSKRAGIAQKFERLQQADRQYMSGCFDMLWRKTWYVWLDLSEPEANKGLVIIYLFIVQPCLATTPIGSIACGGYHRAVH